MKIFQTTIIATTALISLVSCAKTIDYGDIIRGNGPAVTAERKPGVFHSISCQIGAEINIIECEETSVTISIQENLLEHLETNVSDGSLLITFGNKSIITTEPVKIDFYVPSVAKFSLSGSGNIFSELPLNEIHIAGSGSVICKGETESTHITISGSGEVDLFDMPVKQATAKIFGNGSVKVQVEEKLTVAISGSGSVFYKGQPQVQSNITGSGTIVDYN